MIEKDKERLRIKCLYVRRARKTQKIKEKKKGGGMEHGTKGKKSWTGRSYCLGREGAA